MLDMHTRCVRARAAPQLNTLTNALPVYAATAGACYRRTVHRDVLPHARATLPHLAQATPARTVRAPNSRLTRLGFAVTPHQRAWGLCVILLPRACAACWPFTIAQRPAGVAATLRDAVT